MRARCRSMLLPHAGAGFGRASARVLVRGALPKQSGVTRLDRGSGGHGRACGQEGEENRAPICQNRPPMAGVPLPKSASDGARMPFWASDGNFSSFWTKISDPPTWSLPKSASVGTEQDAIGGRFWYQKMPTDIDFGFWLPLEVDFGSTRAANGGCFCLM